MVEAVLLRRRVRPGKTERLREWFDELGERREEVLETLRAEGMYTESAFVRETPDGDYAYFFLEAADVEEALATYSESEKPIDREHRAVLDECLEDGMEMIDADVHLSNPGRP